MARTRFGFALAGIALWLTAHSSLAAIVPPLSQPSWKELSAEQQRVLAPLATEWDKLESYRRKKWLGVAERYKSQSPDEQARVDRNMKAWARLTPDERKQARDKYLKLQKASPERKEAVKQKWEAYKELPESERARLKAEAAKKPSPRPPTSKHPVAPAKAAAPAKPSHTPATSLPAKLPASPPPATVPQPGPR